MLEFLFNKGSFLTTLLKKDSNTGAFSAKFEKFLRKPILKNICERLLLYRLYFDQIPSLAIYKRDLLNQICFIS